MAAADLICGRGQGLGPATGEPYPSPRAGEGLRRGQANPRIGARDQHFQAAEVFPFDHRLRRTLRVEAREGCLTHGLIS